jgi:hypothetical protein
MSMPSAELDRLVSINLLAHEPPIRAEYEGLVEDAAATLRDAQNQTLSLESRFRLAYGSVHSVALAAPVWRMLARAHEQRNRREYEGRGEIDARLLSDVIAAGIDLLARIREFPVPEDPA